MGMEFVLIPPGKFVMGAPPTEVYWSYGTEQPLHEVTIARPFYLGKYPVTQEEWESVMWNNPSGFVGDERLPVESVSWDDCRDFITELNCRKDGWSYRFPSEAQWEYACRAGTTTAFAYGDNLTADQANCDGISDDGDFSKRKSRHGTTPVGKFPPNAWGLYDMHGKGITRELPPTEASGRAVLVRKECCGAAHGAPLSQSVVPGRVKAVNRIFLLGGRACAWLRARASLRFAKRRRTKQKEANP